MDRRHSQGERGEEAVNKIAFETYFKYWCYPSPKDERGSKKEICDLLILFKRTAIIISVKNYSFSGDYEKYFRSTLDKAISQIQGAERKLFENIKDVFIKHPEMDEIKFIAAEYSCIYRIILNLNTTPLFYQLGKLTSKGKYVHIFNWEAFLQLVKELDTIPDFIQYLKTREEAFLNKEALLMIGEEKEWDMNTSIEFKKHTQNFNSLNKNYILISGTELDLLADYYFNDRKFNRSIYSTEYKGALFQLDGNWIDYFNRKQVQRKKAADTASYFVDEFIKREVLYRNDKQNIEMATELLSLSRFERRVLGQQFLEFCEKYKAKTKGFIARRYGLVNDEIVIGFLLHSRDIPDEVVIKLISIAMEGYCLWEKYKTKKMILISVSNQLGHFKFGYMNDIQPFPVEYERYIEEDLKLLNWFQNIENIMFSINEYPDE